MPATALAFGGAPLIGDRFVRIAYMDEAGISSNEPVIVVASVLIDGDKQYRSVNDALSAVKAKHLPLEDRNIVFHATDLFSGGKYFHRETWSREKRWNILLDILEIVPSNNVPICLSCVKRDTLKSFLSIQKPDENIDEAGHAMAFMVCVITIDKWMKTNAKDEFTVLVAEDANKTKSRLKRVYENLSKPEILSRVPYDIEPVSAILDTPHFVKKTESNFLQLADAWAFILRRKMLKKPDVSYFSHALDRAAIHFIRFPK